MTGRNRVGRLAWTDFAYISLLLSVRVRCNRADEGASAAAATATPTTITTTITATTLKLFGEHSYWLIRDASGVTWYQATGYCRRQYGGRLAIVDDVDKITHITNELTSLSSDITPAWLGAKSNESLHDWITVNGSVIITGIGHFDESNEDGNCLALTSGQYRTIFCSTKVGLYLCDIPRQPDLSQCDSANCLTLFNATDFNWFDARRECIKAGGDLASVLYTGKLMEQRKELRNEFIIIGGYRRPWWWMSGATSGLKEVLYYNWIEGMEKYSENSCLATTSSGWQPIKCNDTTTYFICEGELETLTTVQTPETNLSSSQSSKKTSTGPNVIYIIIGCLAGGLVVFIIIVVILVVCLRRARKHKESEEFQYQDRRTTLASSLSAQISTVSAHVSSPSSSPSSTSSSSSAHHQGRAAVVQRSPDPYGVQNYVYEEAEPVTSSSGAASVSPYAASRIESIMERGSAALNQNGGVPDAEKPRGSALNALIKRLSLLMKRDYDESREALPSAATTLQRNPDVVPMTSFNPYEDISECGKKVDGAVGGPSSPPAANQSSEPVVMNNVYSEVNPRKGNIDLVVVDNRGYVSQL